MSSTQSICDEEARKEILLVRDSLDKRLDTHQSCTAKLHDRVKKLEGIVQALQNAQLTDALTEREVAELRELVANPEKESTSRSIKRVLHQLPSIVGDRSHSTRFLIEATDRTLWILSITGYENAWLKLLPIPQET